MRRAITVLLMTALSACHFPPQINSDLPPYGDKQQSLTLSEQNFFQRYGIITAIGAGLLVGLLSDADREALGL